MNRIDDYLYYLLGLFFVGCGIYQLAIKFDFVSGILLVGIGLILIKKGD